ncbi:MAG TPA: hypothetical protein VFO77_06870, partial [Actinoplanes sp.]|nr:hypothetical protein [Actinoplanes sp.]
EGTAIVGPLVPPSGGPCLHCVDLHRADRDPDWPQLAAQLAPSAPEICDVATVLAATAYATAAVLTYLDGGAPDSLGAAIELTTANRSRRRTWIPHPSCRCGRRRTGKTSPQPQPR